MTEYLTMADKILWHGWKVVPVQLWGCGSSHVTYKSKSDNGWLSLKGQPDKFGYTGWTHKGFSSKDENLLQLKHFINGHWIC